MADTPSTTTQTMVATLGATVAKNLLMIVGSSLAAHGIIGGSNTETFVSIGMVLVGGAWSFWNSYGRAIVLAKLEVWKATAQAQAEALDRAKVLGPTTAEIADKIPDPAVTASSVAKVITAGCLALLVATALFATPALAQRDDSMTSRSKQSTSGTFKLPIDPLNLNTRASTGNPLQDLLGALDAKLLPDLQNALKLATASGSKVTAPCYSAWIDIIQTRQKASLDDNGQPIDLPEPHIVTDFERMVELRNALQPDSAFMIACSPVASMVKKDIMGFIGVVLSGGAGLATLVPGL